MRYGFFGEAPQCAVDARAQAIITAARDQSAQREIAAALTRLGRLLASRPFRRVQLGQPLGRLLADFSDACASGAEGTAARLLQALDGYRATLVR